MEPQDLDARDRDPAEKPLRRICALSILQPWAELIVHGPKRVENRMWSPDPAHFEVGDYIAIHAGKTVSAEQWGGAVELANDMGAIDELPVLAGLRRVERAERGDRFAHQRIKRYCEQACAYGALVGVARFGGIVRRAEDLPLKQRMWFVGPRGWILHPVVAIAPIPLGGQRSLFALNPIVLDQLRLAVGAALESRRATSNP